MAPNNKPPKPTEPSNDPTGVDGFDQLPSFIQNMQWRNIAISTDEMFALRLASFGKENWIANDPSDDYPEKEFFMRVAKSLPDAFKLTGTPINQSTSVDVLDLLDVKAIYKTYADSHPEDKEKAVKLSKKISGDQKKWWSEQAPGTADQRAQYEENSGGLSPEAYATEQISNAGAMAPGQAGFDAAAAVGDMTAQEYAQSFVDTTLADLGFDEALRFNLTGLVNGSPVGPDGGYDVYKAPQFLYGLTPDQLTKLQSSLQAAGYFDSVGDTPRFGDNRDRATRLAWDLFLVDVVAAGEQASPQDVLNNRITMQGNKTMPVGGTYADQATLRQMANEFGRAIVGRNLTIAEQQDFLNKAREWEKEAVLRFGVGQDTPSLATDTERVDIQSRAELYFQDQFNIEAGRVALSEWAAQFK
jgi:hypothetical protein